MKRLILAVVGLVVVVFVALVLYLTFGDLSRFRPNVEAAVSRATGREFRIAGEFKPKILPTPSLVVEGVTLANAEWGAQTPMISVGKASVEIGLWSLVSGPIRVKKLELQDIAILVEQNASGASNWSMGTPAPPAPPPQKASGPGLKELPAIIELASVGNVTVLVKRPDQDDMRGAVAKFDLRTDDAGVIVAEGGGQLRDTPFTLHGKITRTADRRAQVDLTSMVADAGVIAHALVGAQEIDFDATVDDISKLAAAFSVQGVPTSDLAVGGKLIMGSDRYELRDATAKLLGTDARGRAVIPQGGSGPVDVEVELAASDIATLHAGLPSMALMSSATAKISPERIEVDPFSVTVGDSDFAGSLVAKLGETLSLSVNGKSKLIDLTPFQDAKANEPAPTNKEKPPAAKENGKQWVFGEDELPFDKLTTTSLDAKVSIAELKSRDTEARNVELALTNDGKQTHLATSLDAEGGSLKGDAVLAVANKRADLDVDLTAQDLRLNLASGNVAPSEIPPIGLAAKLRSSGGSPRALASSANGHLLLTQGKGRIDSAAIGLVSGDVFAQIASALNPFAKKDKYTNWDCTVVALNIVDGVATLDPMLAQAEKFMITGGGKVDLKTEKLDIEFNTKPRTGVGITPDMFVTPFVKIGGTLAKPGVGMNATGTLLNGGAAAMTGGLSVLVKGVADRITAQRDQCVKSIEKANAAEASATQGAATTN
jgi:uncharacterized protein involved in outer membrane biogenesis